MKSIALAAVALSIASNASAQSRAYLVKQWFERGNQMCQYSNGTVLNMGSRTCPTSI